MPETSEKNPVAQPYLTKSNGIYINYRIYLQQYFTDAHG